MGKLLLSLISVALLISCDERKKPKTETDIRAEIKEERRYSPAKLIGITINPVIGQPDPNHISTSYIERQNLTMRMSMRRFTRLTNGFSKKLDNLKAAVAVHFYHYNFMRQHITLDTTPAIAAGITNDVWGWDALLEY